MAAKHAYASTGKLPISALPLPPTTHILTHNLTADKATPSPRTFREVLTVKPSVQRRSRLVDSKTHFTHLTPLPLPFPYRIAPPEGVEVVDKSEYVEQWLGEYEPLDEQPAAPSPTTSGVLKKYTRDKRNIPRELIGLAPSCLDDCLPHLAVGDAFVHLGPPSLTVDEDIPVRPSSGADKAIREELVDILTGHSVLMGIGEEAQVPYAPWSLRYSGHQFGSWAGQLGDGRAISILETPHPSVPDLTYELQLKGAGRTPYSRSADGLAVLRSSIREFLCSEAMNALRIPSTRALALVHLPDLDVSREEVESACVLTRLAPSFIRIGSFEAFNPAKGIFFIGGGQQDANYDGLRILGEWVVRRVLKLPLDEAQPWGKELVMECARRNARMVAAWQVYGFMHGVINTDNVSIMGLTIDYGPYAFMDIYDPMHICNHTDQEGRYAYKFQPTMIVYALRALLNALSPLIGAEAELGSAVKHGWADGADDEKLEAWRKKGLEMDEEMKGIIEETMEKEYWHLFRKRLGLETEQPGDVDVIIRPLLNLLESQKLDFHSTFRSLSSFNPVLLTLDTPSDDFIKSLASNSFESTGPEVIGALRAWLGTFAERLEVEKQAAGNDDEDKFWDKWQQSMRRANPRFVLRQWVLEEIIKRVQDDPEMGKRALAKVLEMATNPFELWGGEGKGTEQLNPEEKEERRLCGLGPKTFLGFQCSCSS